MAIEHKPLGYPFDALEPHIDKQTMEIHHGKHYKTYVDNYNKALEKAPQLSTMSPKDVLANECAAAPADVKTVVRNNLGGAVNHELFWEILKPGGSKMPVGSLKAAIEKAFGSFDAFKEKFADASKTRFGSGWAWLVKKGDAVELTSLPNQDSPHMTGVTPILGLDVWEHAYYLKYQNRRPDYIEAFWNVVNWDEAEKKFAGK